MKMLIVVASTLLTIAFHAYADEERYPYRIPDWLLDDERYTRLVEKSDRNEISILLKEAELLNLLNKKKDADRKETEATRKLGSLLALRDLTRDAIVVSDNATGRRIAVHLDPTFPTEIKQVLREAVGIFLRLATSEPVVNAAIAISTDKPEPMPSVTDKGESADRSYRTYIQSIAKPENSGSFTKHMAEVLQPLDGGIPMLIVSAYGGSPWWGSGYYDSYAASDMQLTRLRPQGFLYIRLNADKMKPDAPRFNDPRFWASKIAHEILHNLGYWHPSYNDPAERDKYNNGTTWAFIVAYEAKLLEAASK